MDLTDITVPGTHSLADLEQIADQQEEVLGPLVNLGNAGPNSVLTFNMSSLPPAEFVILRTTPGGNTPAVFGFGLVCQGNCLVGGQLTGVAALRSTGKKPATLAAKPGSALEQELTAQLPAAMSFKQDILDAVATNGVPSAVIAGIGSKESGWGTSVLMQPNGPAGTGDRAPRDPRPPMRPGSMPTDGLGFGRGLMQIDWDSYEFARTGNWKDPRANIDFSCELLAADRDRFTKQMGMSPDDALMAAIAAYNAGFSAASKLIKSQGLKSVFAPGSYAAEVVSRVGFFDANGFGAAGGALAAAAVPGGGPYKAPTPESFMGQSVGGGECVAFVRKASDAPHTLAWRKGELVKNNTAIASGTAIATFDPNGRYGNHTDGSSHAAIYLRQTAAGLIVLDQFRRPAVHPVSERPLRFGNGPLAANDGDKFFVIL